MSARCYSLWLTAVALLEPCGELITRSIVTVDVGVNARAESERGASSPTRYTRTVAFPFVKGAASAPW